MARLEHHGNKRAAPLLAAILLLGLVVAACSPLRGIEAMQVAADIGAGDGPSSLKDNRPDPKRRSIAYRIDGRPSLGDLYLPGDRAEAALVLVPGAAAAGKDDPKFVAFARTLARARFAVLVPEIPNLRALKVRASDARKIADAVRHLATYLPEGGDEGVGVAAISYAVGPAVIAAAEPDTRAQVRFVAAVGGYYDLEAVITFFTTGYFRERPDEPWRRLEPNVYGKWVFLRSNSDFVGALRDRRLLNEIAARKMRRLDADVSDLAAALGPEGRAVYALLVNTERERVPKLIATLPPRVRAELEALDLKRLDVERVDARLLLVHGRDDAIIPYGESVALAEAMGEDAELFLVDNLAHVDLGPGGLGDQITIWWAVYRLLEERDASPAPDITLEAAASGLG